MNTKRPNGPSFANFLGSGDFVDNFLAVSAAGDLYVIGGGPSEEQGLSSKSPSLVRRTLRA